MLVVLTRCTRTEPSSDHKKALDPLIYKRFLFFYFSLFGRGFNLLGNELGRDRVYRSVALSPGSSYQIDASTDLRSCIG